MPPRRSTPKTLHQAGELRKQTTPAEKKLWAYLRAAGFGGCTVNWVAKEHAQPFAQQLAVNYEAQSGFPPKSTSPAPHEAQS